MVKLVSPLHSQEARGSVGAYTYTTLRGVSVVKSRVGPSTQFTEKQVNLRALTAASTAAWKVLPSSLRSLWSDFSVSHLCPDWTGNLKRLSGYNWFVKINVPSLRAGLDIVTVPPSNPPPGILLDMSITVDTGVYYCYVAPGQAVFDGDFLVDLWTTPWGSVGRVPDFHKATASLIWLLDDVIPIPQPSVIPSRIGIFARLIDRNSRYVYEWQKLDYTLEV